ncbi:hypothetical protein N008_17790 [Hymenobacter sp. APR13]|nr:hypothetical protein N008_17790 [Hymenobacter sp. APR13]
MSQNLSYHRVKLITSLGARLDKPQEFRPAQFPL